MNIIIEGAGEIGSHLAKILTNEGNEVVVIDCDKNRLHRVESNTGVRTIEGRLSSISVLEEAGAAEAELFIAVNPLKGQAVNMLSAQIAKSLGCRKVCARIDDEEYLSYNNKHLFSDLRIDMMFYPEHIAAKEVAKAITRNAQDNMDFTRGRLSLSSYKVREDSILVNRTVARLVALLPRSVSMRVVAVRRGNETMIPHANTAFEANDTVYIITTRECKKSIDVFFGASYTKADKVMILGGNEIAEMAACMLSSIVSNVKLIEVDEERCHELSESTDAYDNVDVVWGDGRNLDFLHDEGIAEYDVFVACTGNDETNILTCATAKKIGVSKTIAEVENIDYHRFADDMGVDTIINKKTLSVGKVIKMTLSNKVRSVKFLHGTNVEVLEYIVPPKSKITYNTLENTNFPRNAVIGGVIRGVDSFVAVGSTQIADYDKVIVFAMQSASKDVDRFFTDS